LFFILIFKLKRKHASGLAIFDPSIWRVQVKTSWWLKISTQSIFLEKL